MAPGVLVRRELGRFTPGDLCRVGRQLNRYGAPRRLLVQWVPHGYGYRAMNLHFCWWLWKRARINGDRVEIMLHEPYLPFGGSFKQCGAAVIQRLMTAVLARAASHVWMAIPAWAERWRPFAPRHLPFTWLPVPSTITPTASPADSAALRLRYAPAGGALIGHFGTYGQSITRLLAEALPPLLEAHPERAALLLGRGGQALRARLLAAHPRLAGQMHTTGQLAEAELSRHLSACDLLVQPYPDGVSSRRTSVMAGLAHGLPIVTTTGRLTEPIWGESGAVILAEDLTALVAAAERLLTCTAERDRCAAAALNLYQTRFALRHTIAALGAAPPQSSASGRAKAVAVARAR